MEKNNLFVNISLIVICIGIYHFSFIGSPVLGGIVEQKQVDFWNGFKVRDTVALDSSRNATLGTLSASTLAATGAATLSSTLGVTGATTLSSTLGVTGTSTLTGRLVANSALNTFGSAASSTVQIGAASKGGCLIIGDGANGADVWYITVTTTVPYATTTKPDICQTAV